MMPEEFEKEFPQMMKKLMEDMEKMSPEEIMELLYKSNPWMRPRKPKYRVWDVEKKCWINQCEFDLRGVRITCETVSDREFLFCECSWVEDVNGVHIYAGDILDAGDNAVFPKGTKLICEFYPGRFGVDARIPETEWQGAFMEYELELRQDLQHFVRFGAKVIGNIYENFDLIETHVESMSVLTPPYE